MVITGATLPTIRDGELNIEVANLRLKVVATQLQRTDLTLRCNASINEWAAARSLPFIDISTDLIDAATGVLANRWRHPDPTDHHIHPADGGALWARRLNASACALGILGDEGSSTRQPGRPRKNLR